MDSMTRQKHYKILPTKSRYTKYTKHKTRMVHIKNSSWATLITSLNSTLKAQKIALRWRCHELLSFDRNSLFIIVVVKLRWVFHTLSFPRFPVSRFPSPAKRSRVFQYVRCRVFHSRIFNPCVLVRGLLVSRFPFSRFQRPRL